MYDESKQELDLLREQFSKNEEWFDKELDEAKRMIGIQPDKKPRQAPSAAGYIPARGSATGCNPSAARLRRDVMETEPPAPKTKGVGGLLILALAETLGIAGIAAYWLLVLLK